MSKRTVIKSKWYYDEKLKNLVAINCEDEELGTCKQIKVTNKYGSYLFDCEIGSFVPRGAIALNSYQRRECHLKSYHSYNVEPHISNCRHTMASLINEKFNFRNKVGGADDVFEQLGDLLLPHLYPQSFVSQSGMRKPRGILLSGPPGTGKTLIASIISEMLNVEPKMVRGPEIFGRFMGESEEKIRALFTDAQHDQETLGDQSKLHIIIFDELDSICKRRALCEESTRDSVQDNVTTQLLAEIDGLKRLNNVLIIGTTNLLPKIDPALLRPGRIDLIVKVGLPNDDGRLQIFDLYMKNLLQNGLTDSDIDIETIIRATKGLTGAHIEKIVRLAIISAMRRDVLSHGRLDISEHEAEQLRVCNLDFKDAITKISFSDHTQI